MDLFFNFLDPPIKNYWSGSAKSRSSTTVKLKSYEHTRDFLQRIKKGGGGSMPMKDIKSWTMGRNRCTCRMYYKNKEIVCNKSCFSFSKILSRLIRETAAPTWKRKTDAYRPRLHILWSGMSLAFNVDHK